MTCSIKSKYILTLGFLFYKSVGFNKWLILCSIYPMQNHFASLKLSCVPSIIPPVFSLTFGCLIFALSLYFYFSEYHIVGVTQLIVLSGWFLWLLNMHLRFLQCVCVCSLMALSLPLPLSLFFFKVFNNTALHLEALQFVYPFTTEGKYSCFQLLKTLL